MTWIVLVVAGATLVVPRRALGGGVAAGTRAIQTCGPPAWLAGEWVVVASRLEAVSGRPRDTQPGARMGTCVALPNVGAAPRNYRQRYLDGDAELFNDKETLAAFWRDVSDVEASRVTASRRRIAYTAPTASRGRRRQRMDVEVLERTCAASDDACTVDATVAQSTYVDDDSIASPGVFGTFAVSERFDRLPDDRVRKSLRVAVFPETNERDRPDVVFEYAFLLAKH